MKQFLSHGAYSNAGFYMWICFEGNRHDVTTLYHGFRLRLRKFVSRFSGQERKMPRAM